jgi:hypothetical protein
LSDISAPTSRRTRTGAVVVHVPVYDLLEFDAARLKYEIDKAVREFGFLQLSQKASSYGTAWATIEIRLHQPWESVDL